MGTELADTKSFQKKMMERIRDSIGELMTDEELKKILERGVEEALFKGRSLGTGPGMYEREKFAPSLVGEAVDKYLKQQMADHIQKWIEDHQQELKTAVESACSKGAGMCLVEFLDRRFEDMFRLALQQIKVQ